MRQGGIGQLAEVLKTSGSAEVTARSSTATHGAPLPGPSACSVRHHRSLAAALRTPQVKAEVAGALWSLSEASEIKTQIARDECLAPLVNLLAMEHARVRQHAAAALLSLALDNEENQVASTRMRIELLSSGACPPCMYTHARILMCWHVHCTRAQVAITQMLIELLSSGGHAAQDQAARALWSLVGENPGAHDAIATAGQPAALVELLKQVCV